MKMFVAVDDMTCGAVAVMSVQTADVQADINSRYFPSI
jgi:hypothetical protein